MPAVRKDCPSLDVVHALQIRARWDPRIVQIAMKLLFDAVIYLSAAQVSGRKHLSRPKLIHLDRSTVPS
jgi:hypothetical protein